MVFKSHRKNSLALLARNHFSGDETILFCVIPTKLVLQLLFCNKSVGYEENIMQGIIPTLGSKTVKVRTRGYLAIQYKVF